MEDLYDDVVLYSVRIWNVVIFAKLCFYFLRWWYIQTTHAATEDGQEATAMTSCTPLFGLKRYFATGPVANVGAAFLIVCTTMSYIIMILERPVTRTEDWSHRWRQTTRRLHAGTVSCCGGDCVRGVAAPCWVGCFRLWRPLVRVCARSSLVHSRLSRRSRTRQKRLKKGSCNA